MGWKNPQINKRGGKRRRNRKAEVGQKGAPPRAFNKIRKRNYLNFPMKKKGKAGGEKKRRAGLQQEGVVAARPARQRGKKTVLQLGGEPGNRKAILHTALSREKGGNRGEQIPLLIELGKRKKSTFTGEGNNGKGESSRFAKKALLTKEKKTI